ncbi:MAG: lecithin retinol acyltransferase family protein [Deltaproteobacteria bacterium]|nr:lecithin retinol acyltransferase family protein [Deltaproteobacteria bacterium]
MTSYLMGHLLCVDRVIYDHVGISNGQGKVYENAKGKKPQLVSTEEFAKDKKIIDLGILPDSFLPEEIIERAQKIIEKGKRSYKLLTYNCEHFVREVCGVDIKSPQVQRHIFSFLAGSIALYAKSPHIKGVAGGAAIASLFSKNSEDAIQNSLIGGVIGGILSLIFSDTKSGNNI